MRTEDKMVPLSFAKIKTEYRPESSSDTVDPLVVTWDGESTTMDTSTADSSLGDGSVQLLGTSDALATGDFYLI
jgi:hypothetical protein